MLISLKNVNFKYEESNRLILDNISFSVDRGAYLSVLGENGSGKSTLVKLVLGLHKPDSGTVVCNAKRVGYVPQQKSSFFQLPLTVWEFLSVAKKSMKLKTSQAEKRVLQIVEMEEKKDSLLGNLSGGELQRIFIAQALLGQPDLLILDELSSGVDIERQKLLYNLISSLNKHENLTIIAVEHNLQAAMHNSTEIFHMEKGRGHICSPKQYANEFLGDKNLKL